MPNFTDPATAKRALSSRLMEVAGVSGVGLRGGHVMVYLVDDCESVRRRVEAVVREVAPNAAVRFEVSGSFGKQ